MTGWALINSSKRKERLKAAIAARLAHLWPQLGSGDIDYVWNGYIGITRDRYSRVHCLGPCAYAWAGCNGRTAVLSVALGRELANAAQDTPEYDLDLLLDNSISLPVHGLLRGVAPLTLLAYRNWNAREVA